MKTNRLTLVSKVNGYVHHVRSRVSLLLGGAPMSPLNLEIFLKVYEAWFFLLEDLMMRLGFSGEARDSRRANFVSAIESCDFADVLTFLDKVALFLCGESPDIEGFKVLQCLALDGTNVSGRLLSPVNTAIFSFLTEEDLGNKAHFLAIGLQFLRFPLKVEFQDIGLEAQALESYLETESQLATVDYPDELICSLSKIIRRWFKNFSIEALLPVNGPGSVAEGSLDTTQKFHAMRTDKLVKIILSGAREDSVSNEFFPFPPGDGLDRCSRTIFVPKTAQKLRTISMEPATLQYLQQGVMFELYRYINSHPYLGVRIRLRDQGQNQILALEGSLRHNYATIDLSHASDSVSWALVRRVFGSVPQLYKWLLATRSRETLLPDGNRLRLQKYAPMGSALCFPIQCILFSAVIEHALGELCYTREGGNPLFSVYGDDLVVPTYVAQSVIDKLELLGFSVNRRKTYISGNYRESCGKEYYAGKDISALYYRIPYNKGITPSVYSSLCGSANNALFHSLPTYRDFLISKVISSKKQGPYFGYSPGRSPELYSPTPTNFHTKARWSRRYQRLEGRFLVVKSRPRYSEPDEESLRYFVALVQLARRQRNVCDARVDESGQPVTLQGLVEYFSSTIRPIVPFIYPSRIDAWDWSDT